MMHLKRPNQMEPFLPFSYSMTSCFSLFLSFAMPVYILELLLQMGPNLARYVTLAFWEMREQSQWRGLDEEGSLADVACQDTSMGLVGGPGKVSAFRETSSDNSIFHERLFALAFACQAYLLILKLAHLVSGKRIKFHAEESMCVLLRSYKS